MLWYSLVFLAGYCAHMMLYPCEPMREWLIAHRRRTRLDGPIAQTHYLLHAILLLLALGGALEVLKVVTHQ